MKHVMGRREWLGVAGLGAAAWALGARAQEPARLGAGKHRYEWVRGWAKVPAEIKFGPMHGCVAVDSQDRVIATTDTDNAVLIFDPDGKLVKSWGKEIGLGAHGICLSRERGGEFLFIANHLRHEVVKTDLDGKIVMKITQPAADAGLYKDPKSFKPCDVAVTPGGDIYIADGYGLMYIHQLKPDGTPVRSWGGAGKEEGKFNTPHGICIDARRDPPVVIVADRNHGRLQIFSLEGKFLSMVQGDFRMPAKVRISGQDVLIPDLQGRMTLLDQENKLIAHLGENEDKKKWANFGVRPEQQVDGQFTAPHGAAADSKGNLFVSDWNQFGRLSKLKRLA
jgi:hypothetical protein